MDITVGWMWNLFIWLRIWTSGGPLWMQQSYSMSNTDHLGFQWHFVSLPSMMHDKYKVFLSLTIFTQMTPSWDINRCSDAHPSGLLNPKVHYSSLSLVSILNKMNPVLISPTLFLSSILILSSNLNLGLHNGFLFQRFLPRAIGPSGGIPWLHSVILFQVFCSQVWPFSYYEHTDTLVV
jgi:hypothetical protein